jgi:hypothetical protein
MEFAEDNVQLADSVENQNVVLGSYLSIRHQGYHTTYDRGYLKNDLSFICTFHNNLWYNFWGKFTTQYSCF